MKTNAFKGLFLLLFLCLLGCGGKAQNKEESSCSISGFPKEIKVKWNASLQDSAMHVVLLNTAEDSCELQMPYGVFPCEIFHYEKGKWKDVTTQLAPPAEHYKKKEASTSYPFDFLRESGPDDPRRIYPFPQLESELIGYNLIELIRTIHPNETVRFSFSLYNGMTDSIEKGRYRLTFYIDGKPCYIVFEL